MIQAVRVVRGVVKVHQPRHSPEVHPLDQCVEQLAPYDLRAVLHLDQIMKRVGNGERCVVTKRVVTGLNLRLVTRAPQRGTAAAVVILRPHVRATGVVRLEAARAIRLAHWRELPTSCQVGIVCGGACGVAGLQGQKAFEGTRVVRWVTLPKLDLCERTESRKPDVPFAANALIECGANEVAA
eukprot:7389168-Prymnesium_polylepis.1